MDSTEALMGRSNGASALYWFYMDATPAIKLFEGTAVRLLAVNIVGKRCIAASWNSGGTPIGYLNGILAGNFSGVFTPIITAGTTLEIGNIVNNNKLKSKIDATIIISRALTATEHARVYAQLENMTWNTKGLTPGPMMP